MEFKPSVDYFQKRKVILDTNSFEPVLYYTENTPLESIEEVRFLFGKSFKKVKLPLEEFSKKLEHLLTEEKEGLDITSSEKDLPQEISFNLLESYSNEPVVNFINKIILKASRIGASDIHIDPGEKEGTVKFRLDGVLQEYQKFPITIYSQLISRIKVMANLNVAEKRLPQDGRIRIRIGKKEFDIRVSILPTILGERGVLRLLDQSGNLLTLEDLGLLKEDYEKVKRLAKKPYGLVLVTGPTGAGKTTTLYAMLLLIKQLFPYKNIVTIEDPVEYQIKGIAQVQVNPKTGLTFASGLRSILRQDPDVILVGEIRDSETAQIAIHAALTGHLVLSTLHTNDAPTAVSRLVDMGVEPYLIASSLEGIIAQRLVRKICPHCKTEYPPSKEEMEILGITNKNYRLFKGKGCENCLNTGYKGRTGIFEILSINEELRKVILKTSSATEIKKFALKEGFKTLKEDGTKKVLKGITTLSEFISILNT